MSDSGYTVNGVTDASLRESFMYAQLVVRGLDTNMIGTPLTVELSKAFDAYFAAHDKNVRADQIRKDGRIACTFGHAEGADYTLAHNIEDAIRDQIGESK